MKIANRFLREPINSLSHFVAVPLYMAGGIILVILTWGETAKMISLTIFGTSLVLLFATSSLFHAVKLSEEKRFWLNRLDHAAIFVFIAGTYTPIVAILFPDEWRSIVLGVIWAIALVGIVYKIFSKRIHGLLNASLYPAISWAGAVPVLLLSRFQTIFSTGGFRLILLGGIIYTIGFFIYLGKRPNPLPGVFGHHEIWHLFVLGGSLCHFLFMFLYIVPHGG